MYNLVIFSKIAFNTLEKQILACSKTNNQILKVAHHLEQLELCIYLQLQRIYNFILFGKIIQKDLGLGS